MKAGVFSVIILLGVVVACGQNSEKPENAETKPDCEIEGTTRLHEKSLKMMRQRAEGELRELEDWKAKNANLDDAGGACTRNDDIPQERKKDECRRCHIDDQIESAKARIESLKNDCWFVD